MSSRSFSTEEHSSITVFQDDSQACILASFSGSNKVSASWKSNIWRCHRQNQYGVHALSLVIDLTVKFRKLSAGAKEIYWAQNNRFFIDFTNWIMTSDNFWTLGVCGLLDCIVTTNIQSGCRSNGVNVETIKRQFSLTQNDHLWEYHHQSSILQETAFFEAVSISWIWLKMNLGITN